MVRAAFGWCSRREQTPEADPRTGRAETAEPVMQRTRPRDLRRALALTAAILALSPAGAFSGTPAAAQAPQDAPAIHFAASGPFAFASARITVDVRLQEGARLTVTLTPPSGASRDLSLTRAGNRFSWTGQLDEAGPWRAEATVSGAGPAGTASATVSVEEGAPTCAVTVHAPEQPTHYLTAEFVADSCGAAAVTGEIATRYITVLQDGIRIASMDASDRCERRFILPGGGSYEATLAVADDRGVTATCTSMDLDVAALYPRFWPIADLATGLYNSERPDVADDVSGAAWLGGGGIGLTVPHDAASGHDERPDGPGRRRIRPQLLARLVPRPAADPADPGRVLRGGRRALGHRRHRHPRRRGVRDGRLQPARLHRRRADAGVHGTAALRAAHQRPPEQLLRSHRRPLQLQADAPAPGALGAGVPALQTGRIPEVGGRRARLGLHEPATGRAGMIRRKQPRSTRCAGRRCFRVTSEATGCPITVSNQNRDTLVPNLPEKVII